MNDYSITRASGPSDGADFVSHNVWLHDRLVLAVITDADGNYCETQIALVSEWDDDRPVLGELAAAFQDHIGVKGANFAAHSIDVREVFTDAFSHLLIVLAEEQNWELANALATEIAQ